MIRKLVVEAMKDSSLEFAMSILSTMQNSQHPAMTRRFLVAWIFCLGLMILGTGCAAIPLKNPLPIAEDVHAKKEKRREEIVKEYEAKRSTALYQSALTRLRQGDDAGCRQALEKLLELNPHHAEGRLLKAEDHLMRYELLEAQQEIDQVLNKAPEHPQALHAMGLVKEALGESEAAAEYFGHAAELAPEDPLVAMDYQTSMDPTYISHGVRPESAAPAGFDSVSNDSVSAQDHVQAVKLASERASQNTRVRVMLRRGLTAMHEGDTEVAITQVQQAMNLESENIWVPQLVALEAIKTNHPEVACPILKASVQQFPQSTELYRLYGVALYQDQQYAAAENALRKAVSLDNRNALAYFLLGQVLSRVGQSDQSQQCLTEAVRLDPSLSAQTLTR